MGQLGIIKDFVLPREIYIGCRQQETVVENNNNRMLHNKRENEMYADLVSYLDHRFMNMQLRNPYKDNIRIQRQKGGLYVCGMKFDTPIAQMRTSVNVGDNILCPHEPEAPKELDGGKFLVKVVIPAS